MVGIHGAIIVRNISVHLVATLLMLSLEGIMFQLVSAISL